jgi:hypothetical protein
MKLKNKTLAISEELLACFRKEKRQKGKREKENIVMAGRARFVCLRKMEKKKEKGKRKNP